MRALIGLVVMYLLINSTVCLGQSVLINKGDSLICFSLPQGRWLLKQTYRVRELTAMDSICEVQLAGKNEVIKNQKTAMMNKDLINNNNNELLQLKQDEVNYGKEKLKQANKTIRKEKVKRWVITVVATLVVAYETYLIVLKKG